MKEKEMSEEVAILNDSARANQTLASTFLR